MAADGTLDGVPVTLKCFQNETHVWFEYYTDQQSGILDSGNAICTLLRQSREDEKKTTTVLFLDKEGKPPKPVNDVEDEKPGDNQSLTTTAPLRLRALCINDFEKAIPMVPSFDSVGPESPLKSSTIHIIVSPASGMGTAPSFLHRAVVPLIYALDLPFQDCPPEIHYHTTTSATFIEDLATTHLGPAAARGETQTIVLLSGDGGVVELLNGLINAAGIQNDADQTTHVGLPTSYVKPTLCLLPHGTANALAHSTHVADATEGLRALVQGHPKQLPLFRASFSPGARLLVDEGRKAVSLAQLKSTTANHRSDVINVIHGAVVFSWALHATLVADSDTSAYRKYGAKRFQMAAQELLFPAGGGMPHEFQGRVSILLAERDADNGAAGDSSKKEWRPIDGTSRAYLLATLVSNLEKTFTMSPASKPLDGQMRLVEFGPVSGEQCMQTLMKAYDGGKHVEEVEVRYEAIEGLRIEFNEDDERWRRCCVDGRIVRVEKGGWVEVIKADLGVVDLAWLGNE